MTGRYVIAIERSGAIAVFDTELARPVLGDVVHYADTREECDWIVSQVAVRSREGDGWIIADWFPSLPEIARASQACARLSARRARELKALTGRSVL